MKFRAIRIDGWTDTHSAWNKPSGASAKIILEFLITIDYPDSYTIHPIGCTRELTAIVS
jgi:hypothetical protein